MVVTDAQDWGGWRVPGSEYDRDPARFEKQARLISAAPQMARLAQRLKALVSEAPEDAPPAVMELAREAHRLLKYVSGGRQTGERQDATLTTEPVD